MILKCLALKENHASVKNAEGLNVNLACLVASTYELDLVSQAAISVYMPFTLWHYSFGCLNMKHTRIYIYIYIYIYNTTNTRGS